MTANDPKRTFGKGIKIIKMNMSEQLQNKLIEAGYLPKDAPIFDDYNKFETYLVEYIFKNLEDLKTVVFFDAERPAATGDADMTKPGPWSRQCLERGLI